MVTVDSGALMAETMVKSEEPQYISLLLPKSLHSLSYYLPVIQVLNFLIAFPIILGRIRNGWVSKWF